MLVRAFNSGWGRSVPDERDAEGILNVMELMRTRYWYVFGWGTNAVDQRWWTVAWRTTETGPESADNFFY